MNDDEATYRTEVRAAVQRSVAAGLSGHRLLQSLSGADPRLVQEFLEESSSQSLQGGVNILHRDESRRYTGRAASPATSSGPYAKSVVVHP